MNNPAHHRLDWHGGVHHPDEGEGGVAGGDGVRQGRCVTAVTDGAGHGRRGCDGGGLRPCGCRRRFRQIGDGLVSVSLPSPSGLPSL